MPAEYMTPTFESRKVQVQLALAGKGQHTAPPSIVDSGPADCRHC
jgi:hypothetical protein